MTVLLAAFAAALVPQSPAAATPTEIARLQTDIAALCGRPFARDVALRIDDEQALATYTESKLERELGDGKAERLDAWLHAMALLPADRTFRREIAALLGGQIAGVYDYDQKVMHLAADTRDLGDWYARYTVAHELVHALDDQELSLGKVLAPSDGTLTKDRLFALGAAVEGSALAIADRWAAKNPPPENYDPMPDPKARAAMQKANAALAQAPAYCTLQLGRHIVGRAFMAAGRELKKVADDRYLGLLSIAGELPQSSEQVLHPAKFWLEKERDAPVLLADDGMVDRAIVAALPKLAVLDHTTLGELVIALLAEPVGVRRPMAQLQQATAWTNAAATGWGGDRLFVVGSGGGAKGEPVTEPGAIWITVWDTAADRAEFAAALRTHRTAARAVLPGADGRLAVFAFGSAATIGDDALAAIAASCTFTRDSKAFVP